MPLKCRLRLWCESRGWHGCGSPLLYLHCEHVMDSHSTLYTWCSSVTPTSILFNVKICGDLRALTSRAFRYVVDKKDEPSFVGSEGYITDAVLRQHVPPPSDDNLILVCGPPPMMKAISGDKAKDKSQGKAICSIMIGRGF